MENLNDNTDKKIAEKFKAVFENYEFENNEADWQKMQILLDGSLPEENTALLDEKISKKFTSVFENHEFEYKEADWQKMQNLLEINMPEFRASSFDEKITQRFKDTFRQHEFDCRESDWQKMRALLDLHLPEKAAANWNTRSLLFIFVFVLTFLGRDCHEKVRRSLASDVASAAVFETSTKEAEKSKNTGYKTSEAGISGLTFAPKNNNQSALSETKPASKSKKLSGKVVTSVRKVSEKLPSGKGRLSFAPLVSTTKNQNPDAAEKSNFAGMTAEETAKKDASVVPNEERNEIPSGLNFADSAELHFTLLPLDTIKASDLQAFIPLQSPYKPKYLRIGVSYAPIRNGDFKPFKDMTVWSTGHEISFHADWIISRDLSLQTSASWFYFNKKFLSDGEFWSFYNQIPSHFAPVVLPTEEVNLSILNIPLDVRINLVNARNSAFYITTGISNFILLSEYYRDYKEEIVKSNDEDGPSRTIYMKNTEYRRRAFGKINFGTALNLSIGVEKKISDKFSVQFEPFYRKPLGNPDFERVYFHTLGARLRVNWLPEIKKMRN
jgi:hypothetical protein